MPKWKAYCNKSIAEHVFLSIGLNEQGYRLQSLCLHGPDYYFKTLVPQYSAIWVQRPGPDWDILHLGTENELQAFLEEAKTKAKPYWPRLIAAYGADGPGHYSVVVEQGGAESYVEVGTFGFLLDVLGLFESKREKLEFPRSIAVYGDDVNNLGFFRCAFVWEKQPADAMVYFNGFPVAENDVPAVDAAVRAGFGRIDYAGVVRNYMTGGGSVSKTRRYFLIYRDDTIPGTALKPNLTEQGAYQAMEDGKAADKWPIRISGTSLIGAEQRFTVVLADYPHDKEPARSWTISRPTYPASAGPLPWKPFKPLEQVFRDSMKRNSVHAGQIAVAYKGRLIYTAGFTWAPPGYPVTSPTTRFRVGSISKTITALAVCQLWEQGKLYPYPYLPENSIATLLKRNFKDWRFKLRHCGQLLAHLGRFDEPKILAETDPFKVAADLGVSMPIKMGDVVDWIAAHMNDAFTEDKSPEPGGSPLPQAKYCGVGFTMMAQICAEFYAEKGYASYEQGVRRELFSRVGVTRPRATLMKAKFALGLALKGEEALCHVRRPGWWYSQQGDGKPAPIAYDPTNSNVYLGNGAWAMACADYARVLSAFDESPNPLYDNPLLPNLILTEQADGWYRGVVRMKFDTASGGSVDAMWHNGMCLGGTAVGFRRFDGVVIVYAYNCDIQTSGLMDVDANAAVNTLTSWPGFDLFPSVGIE
jgi:CubicO group peptidase (beta-lactamase class C family)